MTDTSAPAHPLAIDELAARLAGDERIDAGRVPVWPPGALDWLALVAQPVRLARAFELRGETARFDLTYVLLDWSTEGRRPDPNARIARFTPDPRGSGGGCHSDAAAHWEAVALGGVDPVARVLPASTVHVVRASSLVSNADFRAVLRLALRRPSDVFEALEDRPAPGESASVGFAAPVCRQCGTTAAVYEYIEGWDRVQSACAACGHGQEADVRELDYRVDRRVLEAAVSAALRPAARLLTEADHAGGAATEAVSRLAGRAGVEPSAGPILHSVAPHAVIEPPDVDLDLKELMLLAAQLDARA